MLFVSSPRKSYQHQCHCATPPHLNCCNFFIYFLTFDFCRFCVVIRVFSSPPQRPILILDCCSHNWCSVSVRTVYGLYFSAYILYQCSLLEYQTKGMCGHYLLVPRERWTTRWENWRRRCPSSMLPWWQCRHVWWHRRRRRLLYHTIELWLEKTQYPGYTNVE